MKVKRILSLILAIVMVLSFMAMSASAATTEVQPRATCPQCGGYGFVYYYSTVPNTTEYWNRPIEGYHNCKTCAASHAHYWVPAVVTHRCSTCGHKLTVNTTVEFCPYGG